MLRGATSHGSFIHRRTIESSEVGRLSASRVAGGRYGVIMPLNLPLASIPWTTRDIDRHANRRPDSTAMSALRNHPQARVLDLSSLSFEAESLWQPVSPDMEVLIYLGDDGDQPRFVHGAVVDSDGSWQRLRFAAELDDGQSRWVTAALGLVHWHDNHRYCNNCGAITQIRDAGWLRLCGGCGRESYPRTDPAVIMAVVDREGRLLLHRAPHWPADRYSTLAGFVEPGESLEQAVRRETLEECGVDVTDVVYAGSQPWPFPRSVMVGFFALAQHTALELDPVEVADARWFTRKEFTASLASGALAEPSAVSISGELIRHWLAGADFT